MNIFYIYIYNKNKKMPKVSVYLEGGLGNQLYMIAAIIGYARKHNIEYEFIRSDKALCNYRSTYWNTILSNVKTVIQYSFNPVRFHVETDGKKINQYYEMPYNEEQSYEFKGYFQSYLYFDDIYHEFRNMIFTCNSQIMSRVNQIYENIKYESVEMEKLIDSKNMDMRLLDEDVSPLVFIHVRRTDYLKYPDKFIILNTNYYQKAITYFPKNTHYVIFSDDINYCLQYFDFIPSKSFIQDNDYIELLLMSKMNGAIIANSTFSTWGAYLMDEHKDKTVVCPRWWLYPQTSPEEGTNNQRLYPHWIKLDNFNKNMSEII
jgi:hypothetical protein